MGSINSTTSLSLYTYIYVYVVGLKLFRGRKENVKELCLITKSLFVGLNCFAEGRKRIVLLHHSVVDTGNH